MEVFDDLLEEYKNNRKSAVDSTDFTAEKIYLSRNKNWIDSLLRICYGPLADKSNALSSFLTEPLADKSNAFPSLLTVSRKLKYSCLYIFHITYPEE